MTTQNIKLIYFNQFHIVPKQCPSSELGRIKKLLQNALLIKSICHAMYGRNHISIHNIVVWEILSEMLGIHRENWQLVYY